MVCMYMTGKNRAGPSVHEGLPSQNVTALAESKGYFYVGTDNGLVRIQEQNLRP